MLRKTLFALLCVLTITTSVPTTGCLGNLVGGCPLTDDGTDDCTEGATECAGDSEIRTCIGAGPCDAYWSERSCKNGQKCSVENGLAACRSR